MSTVNMHAAKTQLSRLVDRASAGEEIIIAKDGKPAARLMPLATELPKRVLGLMGGIMKIPEDFDAPLPDDFIDMMEGKGKSLDRLFHWDEADQGGEPTEEVAK